MKPGNDLVNQNPGHGIALLDNPLFVCQQGDRHFACHFPFVVQMGGASDINADINNW
jgi:hypothetical protein